MINTFHKPKPLNTSMMGFVEKNVWRFFVTFPAFLSIGQSQAPLWVLIILFSIFLSKKLRHIDIIVILTIVCLFIVESLINGNISSISVYRLQIIMSVMISFFFVKTYAVHDIISVLKTAIYVNLALAGLEIVLPQICEYMHYINRVRSCVDGRPSGAYSEPSHIAFLILLAGYLSFKCPSDSRFFQFALVMLGLITISGTLIVGSICLIAYGLIPLSNIGRFVAISMSLILANLFYLEMRLADKLPMQQSFDKRSSYTTMFTVAPRLLPTFTARKTNQEFYKDFRYEPVMYNNEEIREGYASGKAVSLSILGTFFFVLGIPLSILTLILMILSKRKISNAGLLLLLWFGLPAALPILPLIFSLIRKRND